jgi:hypothetical protein
MTLEAALVLISELHVQNAALREQNAHLQANNAAQRERMAVLEQRIAALEAEKRPPPPWVKANRVKGEKPADERRRQRAPEANRGRERSTPSKYVQHA